MKFCDSHVHSNNSFDAVNSVEELCIAAIEKRLDIITITDHCETWDIDNPRSEFGDFNVQIPNSIKEVNICREKYRDKLRVLTGLELGEPCHDRKLTEKALNYGKYDFILASVHNLKGEDDFYFLKYTQENTQKLLQTYFEEVLQTAAFPYYDSLAHLTYPVRYIMEKSSININYEVFYPVIDEIFRTVIKNGKALELNTSGLRQAMGTTMPDAALLKRYRALGGQLLTIGSDAHNTKDLGAGLETAVSIAKSCGFDGYVIYHGHQPVTIPFT